jgi:hypothetical protein
MEDETAASPALGDEADKIVIYWERECWAAFPLSGKQDFVLTGDVEPLDEQ